MQSINQSMHLTPISQSTAHTFTKELQRALFILSLLMLPWAVFADQDQTAQNLQFDLHHSLAYLDLCPKS